MNIIKIPPAPLWKGENMKNAANMSIIMVTNIITNTITMSMRAA